MIACEPLTCYAIATRLAECTQGRFRNLHGVSSYDSRLVPVLTAKLLDMGMPNNSQIAACMAKSHRKKHCRVCRNTWQHCTVGNTTHTNQQACNINIPLPGKLPSQGAIPRNRKHTGFIVTTH